MNTITAFFFWMNLPLICLCAGILVWMTTWDLGHLRRSRQVLGAVIGALGIFPGLVTIGFLVTERSHGIPWVIHVIAAFSGGMAAAWLMLRLAPPMILAQEPSREPPRE